MAGCGRRRNNAPLPLEITLLVKSGRFVRVSGPLSKSGLAAIPSKRARSEFVFELHTVNKRSSATKCIFFYACRAWAVLGAIGSTVEDKTGFKKVLPVYANRILLEPNYETVF